MIDYKNINSICFVFLHGIGDFIMFTPTLNKIKTINPKLKISIVMRKELGLKSLAENLGFLENVFEISLRIHPRFYIPWIFWTYEYWIIKKRLNEILIINKFDNVKIIYTQLLPTIAYKFFCPQKIKRHKIDRFASELGIVLTNEEKNNPLIRIPDKISERVKESLCNWCNVRRITIIGIQRNTFDKSRFIDINEVQKFIDKLNERLNNVFFIIFADKNSYYLEEKLDKRHLEAINLKYSFEIIGERDSLYLASLINYCNYIISIDSSVLNIAGALNKNTIGIFNTYKVHSSQRRLDKDNILCIDKSHVDSNDLIEKFNLLYELCKEKLAFRKKRSD